MGVLDMLNQNTLVKLRVVIAITLVFFSFFIFIGVAVMKDKAIDNISACPLYFDWKSVPPSSNCNYPMAIAIMFQLIYCLAMIVIFLLLLLGKFTADMFLFSDLMQFIYTVVDLVVFFLTFIGACILSAGYNSTCSSYEDRFKNGDCSNLAFSSPAKAAQAGAWISTFVWLFIGVVGFLTLYRTGKIPFLGGGGAAATGASGPTDSGPPPIDTPSNNMEEPKY